MGGTNKHSKRSPVILQEVGGLKSWMYYINLLIDVRFYNRSMVEIRVVKKRTTAKDSYFLFLQRPPSGDFTYRAVLAPLFKTGEPRWPPLAEAAELMNPDSVHSPRPVGENTVIVFSPFS